jgi:hypothetical protein
MSNFMKICPVEAKLFSGEKADVAKLIVAFCNFVSMPNNEMLGRNF